MAIDPGAKGGIAWQDEAGNQFSCKMPETEGDVHSKLLSIIGDVVGAGSRVVLEEVGGFAGEGQPGSSMFKFGRGFGFILGVLTSYGMKIDLVKPQKWQKALSLGTKASIKTPGMKSGRASTIWKNKLKERAQQLFPGQKVTLSTADALLLLEYGNKNQ